MNSLGVGGCEVRASAVRSNNIIGSQNLINRATFGNVSRQDYLSMFNVFFTLAGLVDTGKIKTYTEAFLALTMGDGTPMFDRNNYEDLMRLADHIRYFIEDSSLSGISLDERIGRSYFSLQKIRDATREREKKNMFRSPMFTSYKIRYEKNIKEEYSKDIGSGVPCFNKDCDNENVSVRKDDSTRAADEASIFRYKCRKCGLVTVIS